MMPLSEKDRRIKELEAELRDIRISLSVIQNLQAVEKQIRHCLQRGSVKRDCPLKRCAEGYLSTGIICILILFLIIWKPYGKTED